MKLKLVITLITIVISTQINAAQFFSLQHEKNGKNYSNQLAHLNSEDGSILQTAELSKSYKYSMEKLALPESRYMFFYGLSDSKNARLQIADKADLTNIKTIHIDPIHSRLLAQYQLYKFYQLTADQKHLLIHTGKKKNQNLLVIDVELGEVVNKIQLSKFKNEVSFSSDQNYILINNTSRDELMLIDAIGFQTVMTSTLGDYRQYGTIHNDFLYLTKYSGKNPNTKHWIQALNLKSKEKTNFTAQSKHQPIFAASEQTGRLFSISTDDKGKQVILNEITGATISKTDTIDMKMTPQQMFVDDAFNRLLIQGKGRVATINLDDTREFALTKLPFDTVNYLYNKKGDLLYLKEGSGSEVAVVNVKSGELIERSGTGRGGVKFGQFMASVALAGVTGGATGYMYIMIKYSNTGFTLNRDEDKLYVINSKTNDVTHFNASNLTDRKAIATGGGTFLVHQSDFEKAPLWVFSNKRINQINDESFELTKEIEYEEIIGFDFVKDFFIIKTTETIQTFDMKTGNITNQWPMSDAQQIWSEQ